MQHILSVIVENRAGVLLRVSGLFGRRGFNIDSLAVGTTENPEISRITIVVSGDDNTIEQIIKQLNKLIEVIKVRRIDSGDVVARELALIKVTTTSETRMEITQIVNIFRANIVDVSTDALTIEISGGHDKIEAMKDMLCVYGIIEMTRTGIIALQRGSVGIN